MPSSRSGLAIVWALLILIMVGMFGSNLLWRVRDLQNRHLLQVQHNRARAAALGGLQIAEHLIRDSQQIDSTEALCAQGQFVRIGPHSQVWLQCRLHPDGRSMLLQSVGLAQLQIGQMSDTRELHALLTGTADRESNALFARHSATRVRLLDPLANGPH